MKNQANFDSLKCDGNSVEIRKQKLLNFLTKDYLKLNALDSVVFSHYFNTDSVSFLWDGKDESAAESHLSLVACVKDVTQNHQVILTSESSLTNYEEKLNTKANVLLLCGPKPLHENVTVNFYGLERKFDELFKSEADISCAYDALTIDKAINVDKCEFPSLVNVTDTLYTHCMNHVLSNMTENLKNHFVSLEVEFQGISVELYKLTSNEYLESLSSSQVFDIFKAQPLYIPLNLVSDSFTNSSWIFKNNSTNYVQENFEKFKNDKIILISSSKGNGTTENLNRLGLKLKKEFSNEWLHYVKMDDSRVNFDSSKCKGNPEDNRQNLLNFLVKNLLKLNAFHSVVFSYYFDASKVTFLWDGESENFASSYLILMECIHKNTDNHQVVLAQENILNKYEVKQKLNTEAHILLLCGPQPLHENVIVNFYGLNQTFEELFKSDVDISCAYDALTFDRAINVDKCEFPSVINVTKTLFTHCLKYVWSSMPEKLKQYLKQLKVDFQGHNELFGNIFTDEFLNNSNSAEIFSLFKNDLRISKSVQVNRPLNIKWLFTHDESVYDSKKNVTCNLPPNDPKVENLESVLSVIASNGKESFHLSKTQCLGNSEVFQNLALKLKEKFPTKWIQYKLIESDHRATFEHFKCATPFGTIENDKFAEDLGSKVLNLKDFELQVFLHLFNKNQVIFLWDGSKKTFLAYGSIYSCIRKVTSNDQLIMSQGKFKDNSLIVEIKPFALLGNT